MKMILFAALLSIPLASQAESPPTIPLPPPPAPEAPAVKPYPLKGCAVSGDELGDNPKVFVIEGQEFKTCCGKCKAKVVADPAKYLKKIADAQAAEKK